MNQLTTSELEDYAFYESGLSAHGCLEKLDDFTKTAIKQYGQILLKNSQLNEVADSACEILTHIQKQSKNSSVVVISSPLYEQIITTLNFYTKLKSV